ncbi:hypothetical protein ACFPU0_21365 [Pseudomonas sp. GCM10022186]|uniref:hypothetical protein n=1 Tax=Pseudomonas sp. GCM10022186 TaxID=3252650 RepID=UPI003617DF73
MGLEDRNWLQETHPEPEGRTWKRPDRTTTPTDDAQDNASSEPMNHPARQRTRPSCVQPQAQEIIEGRNRTSPPPVSLAVLLVLCLSVAAAALYLYF